MATITEKGRTILLQKSDLELALDETGIIAIEMEGEDYESYYTSLSGAVTVEEMEEFLAAGRAKWPTEPTEEVVEEPVETSSTELKVGGYYVVDVTSGLTVLKCVEVKEDTPSSMFCTPKGVTLKNIPEELVTGEANREELVAAGWPKEIMETQLEKKYRTCIEYIVASSRLTSDMADDILLSMNGSSPEERGKRTMKRRMLHMGLDMSRGALDVMCGMDIDERLTKLFLLEAEAERAFSEAQVAASTAHNLEAALGLTKMSAGDAQEEQEKDASELVAKATEAPEGQAIVQVLGFKSHWTKSYRKRTSSYSACGLSHYPEGHTWGENSVVLPWGAPTCKTCLKAWEKEFNSDGTPRTEG